MRILYLDMRFIFFDATSFQTRAYKICNKRNTSLQKESYYSEARVH